MAKSIVNWYIYRILSRCEHVMHVDTDVVLYLRVWTLQSEVHNQVAMFLFISTWPTPIHLDPIICLWVIALGKVTLRSLGHVLVSQVWILFLVCRWKMLESLTSTSQFKHFITTKMQEWMIHYTTVSPSKDCQCWTWIN